MKKIGYPQWFIDDLYNEEGKEKSRNGELRSDSSILEFMCGHGHIYKSRISNHITLSSGEKKFVSYTQ